MNSDSITVAGQPGIAGAAATTSAIPGEGVQTANVTTSQVGAGRGQRFDVGWLFQRGTSEGCEAPGFDDGDWRHVDLPHDWSIEDLPGALPPDQLGPFDRHAAGGTATGYTVGGEGWYRKHFRIGALPPGARVDVLFGGIAVTCDIWFNGQRVGSHVHAYTPFGVELTPHLNRSGDNVIAVRVRNLGRNSRWYSGSGIYRHVTMDVTPAIRIARWGVGAWTRRIADGRAEIDIETSIEGSMRGQTLVTRLLDMGGNVAAEAKSTVDGCVKQTLIISDTHLWSLEDPHLYTLEMAIRQGTLIVDQLAQPFGVRIVTIDTANGLRINGTPVKLRGGCLHHDNGLLGACAYAGADERRIRILKARGFNAIRSAHNPSAATLRAACDRLGMLLIEESFDMWHVPKEPDDYSQFIGQDWKSALGTMVLSARNSPSVVMWSIGNEIPERSTQEGMEWCWKFANEVRRLDPTRPVTAGLNGVLGEPVSVSEHTARPGCAGKLDEASTAFLDVVGYNYRLEDIEADHERRPDRVVYGSETFPREAFEYKALADRAPYVLGEFVWAAMDYLGEAGLGATVRLPLDGMPFFIAQFPWVNAWCGDIDLIGDQKPQSYARDVIWGLSPLEVLVQRPISDRQREVVANWGWPDELPSWTWPGAEGLPMAVRLYTSGDRVDLSLNGKVVGSQALRPGDRMRTEMVVPYVRGTLEAVAYRNGAEIGRKRLETAGVPARHRMAVEASTGSCDRDALIYVGIATVDAQGTRVPDCQLRIRLTLSGPAELVGFGTANPLAVGSFKTLETETFRGRALAILRGTGRPGLIRIDARSDGVEGDVLSIPVS